MVGTRPSASVREHAPAGAPDRPLLICLLGGFRIVNGTRELPVRSAGKTARLLSMLALAERHRVSRPILLGALWPDSEESRAAHALATMVHGLNENLGDVLGGAAPVLHRTGAYELNTDAGVGVDTVHFDTLVQSAERSLRDGDIAAAVAVFAAAVDFYQGDLCLADDLRAVVERERLRAVFLSLLSRLADLYFRRQEYAEALAYAGRLLSKDPCREDAHRLVMRCRVRMGERAQALRQYRTCAQILQEEFGVGPEPLTDGLFQRIRQHPDSV